MYNLFFITAMNTVRRSGDFAKKTDFSEGFWFFLDADLMKPRNGLA
jgi:hypothetical protein